MASNTTVESELMAETKAIGSRLYIKVYSIYFIFILLETKIWLWNYVLVEPKLFEIYL